MRIKKAVAYDIRQGRFTAIDSATLDPSMEQRNGKEVKCEAELSGKNEFRIGMVRRGNRRQKPKERIDIQGGLNQPVQTADKKLFSPEGGRIALSANERIDGFLSFAIQTKFAYVNKQGRADSARLRL